MNGTPLHRVIEGLVHGKERSITRLKAAIRFFEEKMEDDFPGEPLDQAALSAGTMIAATGKYSLDADAGSQSADQPVGPIGPSGMPVPGELRPHGPASTEIAVGPIPIAGSAPQAVGIGVAGEIGPLVLDARLEVLPTSEARFELLMARVALLEAAISAPKPVAESPIGIGELCT